MESVKEYWGMTCPACERDDGLVVSATHPVRLTEDGTEDLAGDEEFDDLSTVFCKNCTHMGVLRDFYADPADREFAKTSPNADFGAFRSAFH